MRFQAWTAGLVLALTPLADSADFLGAWTAPPGDAGGISRVVVAPGTGNRLEVHLFGRCQPRDCDWGRTPARLYAEGPDSAVVASIAAEFDTGFAHKRLVMRPAVGHALHIEVETDFKDATKPSYAINGAFGFAGDWNEAPRVAENAPSPTPPVPTPAPPAPPDAKPSGEGVFGGLVGLGPRVPDGYASAPGEDCQPFAPGQVRVSNTNSGWRLGDFARTLVTFLRRDDAVRGQALLGVYHFDEQCVVGREHMTMVYWKRAGLVPKESLKGELCAAVDPAAIAAEERDGSWTVGTGRTALLDFGDDRADAERAVSVIRTYRLARQCFAGPPHGGLQYWLAQ
ncbi:MAG TPA: hypothetical protein VG387_18565 [Rhizomicrobium sp.]|nr:hypothetical protein [Rhizomicrobium sp.]